MPLLLLARYGPDKKHIVKLKKQMKMGTWSNQTNTNTSQLPEDSIFNESCKPFLNSGNVPKLNAEQQNTCEGLITAERCC